MPHVVIEYTDDLQKPCDELLLMEEAHQTALSSGLFGENTIKVRLKKFDTAFVAGKRDRFVHVTIYLIDGRDIETKKQLATLMHSKMAGIFPSYASISVDVRDLDRRIYTKSQQTG